MIIIWGAAGHARVLCDILGTSRIAVVCDRATVSAPWDVPCLTGRDALVRWLAEHPDDYGFAVAIGGGHGTDRLDIADWLAGLGLIEQSIIHATACIEPSAKISIGCHILAGAIIGAAARIGRQTILNTRSSVDHDCSLGDGVHIAPGATVCGEVTIGDRSFIGAGATVLPKLVLGTDVTIGAGAVVINDVPNGATLTGIPACPA